jgi:hypothetical protein
MLIDLLPTRGNDLQAASSRSLERSVLAQHTN